MTWKETIAAAWADSQKEKINHCKNAFTLFFTAYASAFILVFILGYRTEPLTHLIAIGWKFWVLAILLYGSAWYIGEKIYDNFWGPLLAKRGWNEYSMFHAALWFIVFMIDFLYVPILAYFFLLALAPVLH